MLKRKEQKIQGEYYIACTARKSGKKRIVINRLKHVNVADTDKAHDLAECLRWIGNRALYSGCNISLMPELLKLIDDNIDHLPVMSEPEDCAWCPSYKQDDICLQFIHHTNSRYSYNRIYKKISNKIC